MEVILDELTPLEFFNHGGIVKLTVNSEDIMKICEVKKKYTFFDYKSYTGFFRNLYMRYLNKFPGQGVYETVNKCLELKPSIGNSLYVVDLKYDGKVTYEFAKFYYSGENIDKKDIAPRDPYGIKNVCFSLVDENDDRWEEFTDERLERGFDESELWNLDYTIACFVYPRLKAFRDGFDAHPEEMREDEWKGILDKILKGFEILISDGTKTEEDYKTEDEALRLFAEYYRNLWV